MNVLVVVAGVLDPKYGQEVGGSKPNRVRYFSHPVANLLQQLVEGQVLIQVGCRWEAIFCRRKDCGLGLKGLTIEFPADKNDFFANFVAFVFCRGKESEGVEVPFRS